MAESTFRDTTASSLFSEPAVKQIKQTQRTGRCKDEAGRVNLWRAVVLIPTIVLALAWFISQIWGAYKR